MQSVSDFRFDEAVVDVFPDMISRSVPGYETIINTIGEIANACVVKGTRVYDLGCSLGAASLAVSRACPKDTCEVIAVDSSAAMTQRCQRVIDSFALPNTVIVQQGLAQQTTLNNASMAIMNFTLQFIEPSDRAAILSHIYKGLNPGGVLLLSEKIKHPTPTGDKWLTELHHQFKRRNGYSELEISQKRAALENVMLTDTYPEHESRLKGVGFSEVVMWYKCYNFMSLIAIK